MHIHIIDQSNHRFALNIRLSTRLHLQQSNMMLRIFYKNKNFSTMQFQVTIHHIQNKKVLYQLNESLKLNCSINQ